MTDDDIQGVLADMGITNKDGTLYAIPFNHPGEIVDFIKEIMAIERNRILAIIEKEPWEVYGDDYYQTYDAQASIAKLKSLIESDVRSEG